MIERVWTGELQPHLIEEFLEEVVRQDFAAMATADGFLGARVLRPFEDDRVTVLLITRWRDAEALRAYAGDGWRGDPVIYDWERPFLQARPKVTHFLEAGAIET